MRMFLGDLSPLSHLSLPLIGLGEVEYKGEVYESTDIKVSISW